MPGLVKIVFSALLCLATSCSASDDISAVDLNLNGKTYTIEIADTYARKKQGLMFRSSIEDDYGMLFPYQSPVQLNIWMKNTLISLAVLWLDEEAKIIHKAVLHPCQTSNCPSFGPREKSLYALELHPGEISRFQVGDQLTAIKDWKSKN